MTAANRSLRPQIWKNDQTWSTYLALCEDWDATHQLVREYYEDAFELMEVYTVMKLAERLAHERDLIAEGVDWEQVAVTLIEDLEEKG